MADRGEVKIREGKIDDLVKIYKQAYERILKDIVDSTEAGKIRKFAVMQDINRTLEKLGVDVDEWVKREMPQYYLDGANQAVQDLRADGYDTSKLSSFNIINKEAILALTDETSLAFAEGIQGISRNARRVLDDALKQQLNFIVAEGRLSGEARKVVSARVEYRLKEAGLGVLRDAGGKEWQYDTYARMLVRTKAVEARNQGLANRMLASGYDLVQVSDHNSTHAVCLKYEGKILSMTGSVKPGTELPGGVTVFATYQKAKEDGLFHPNCKHSINTFNPELAEKTHAYENPYNTLSREEYIKQYPDSPEAIAAKKS